jgi:hypothetical protein
MKLLSGRFCEEMRAFVTGKFSVCPRVNKFYPDFIILLYDEMSIGKHCHYFVINLMIRVKLFDTICDNTIHLKWKTEADFHRHREQITLFTEKHKRSDSIKTII